MGLLAPFFLVGALAAAIPIVLHLLRHEPEARVPFSAVRLLHHARVEHAERRHLRELLLLALRVAAIVLLAIGFARPFFTSDELSGSGRATVVALDTSLSLSAPGQFDRARLLAKEAIARAAPGEPVGVLTFADAAQIAVAPTTDRALVASAVDAASPGAGATRYRAGLAAAAEMMAGRSGTIVVVTDLQATGWRENDRVSMSDEVGVEVADVGAQPPNVAVVDARLDGDRIVVAVRNAGPAPRDVGVRLASEPAAPTSARPSDAVRGPSGTSRQLAGTDQAAASLGPGQTVRVSMVRPAGPLASVSIEDRGGIQADNARYVVLDDSVRLPVYVVTSTGDLAREAFYLQQALAPTTGTAAFEVEGVSTARVSSMDPIRLRAALAIVLVSTRGLDRTGRARLGEFLRGGGGLFIAAGPDVDGTELVDVLGAGTAASTVLGAPLARPGLSGRDVAPLVPPRDASRALAPVDPRHPLFRAFGGNAAALGLPRFERITRVGGACPTLARFTTGEVALAECQVGSGRALVFASDIDNRWNSFPRHTAFLPFVQEAIHFLAGPRPSAAEYTVGEAATLAPSQVGRVHLAGSDVGRVLVDPPADAPISAPGFVQIVDSRTGLRRWAAVNVDATETDPARLSAVDFSAAITRLKGVARGAEPIDDREREERQHIWQYVLVAMLAIMAVESLVAKRTA